MADIDAMLNLLWFGPLPPFSPWRPHPYRPAFYMPGPRGSWEIAGRPAWIESIRIKLTAALAAAAEGRPFEWDNPMGGTR